MSIVKFNDLSFSYPDYPVFKNVSFKIEQNEFVGVIGPNGGGKTTLIKLILGLVNNYQGSIEILGKAPGEQPHSLAYLPQNHTIDNKVPMTVFEAVLMGCLGHHRLGFYTKKDKSLAYEAMKSLDVDKYANKQFSTLSGGQKQRVLIARALTCHPKILILDEPASGIDVRSESVLHDILKGLSNKMTIIMVSHHYNLVSSLVDKVLCVNHNVDIHFPQKIDSNKFKEIISKDYQFVEHHHGDKR